EAPTDRRRPLAGRALHPACPQADGRLPGHRRDRRPGERARRAAGDAPRRRPRRRHARSADRGGARARSRAGAPARGRRARARRPAPAADPAHGRGLDERGLRGRRARGPVEVDAPRQPRDDAARGRARQRRAPLRAPFGGRHRRLPADAAREGDSRARRRGRDEWPDRPHALGHRADGEVPSVQHVPQARRGQPHRGQSLRARQQPRRRRRGSCLL
ncbi:MAG: hypothetical protein AVDCRST_MAG67-1636, partial [uncultured Solirubrobacteraceae bacterium]